MKKKILIIFCIGIICLGIFLVSRTRIKENKLDSDKKLAVFINDGNGYKASSIKSLPLAGYNLNKEKSTCTNGGVISQTSDKNITLTNGKTSKCTLYFDKESTFVASLVSKANPITMNNYNDEIGNKGEMYTFSHDATEQTNRQIDYRFIGSSPNNYVTFNNETWRIVGVFPVDGGTGKVEYRVKIMRNESIGNLPWNSDGTNDWTKATLKTYLNEDYLNGLSTIAKNQIANSTWYLGGSNSSQQNGTAYYKFERGKTVYSGRGIKTSGNVGLIYPSDYIYTYANGVDNTCFNDGYNCNSSTKKENSWMYTNIIYEYPIWSISPFSNFNNYIFRIDGSGQIGYFKGVTSLLSTFPVIYLKSDVKLSGGDGSVANPYTLEEPLVEKLLKKANDASVTTYVANSEAAKQMYTFNHEATEQTGPLTDYRFIGSNPNNWIKFNDEDWRIIGVFNVDGEKKVKIMRNESIGNLAWNTSGKNEWVGSSLEILLNRGDYYNRTGSYAETGLTEIAKSQISSSTWYLGGYNTAQIDGTTYYNFERGKAVYNNQSIKTTGLIGLIYPSDYAYTYANGVDSTGVCYNNLLECDTSTEKINGWIYKDIFSKQHNWLLSPRSGANDGAFRVISTGDIGYYSVLDSFGISPTLYLKSNIKITKGDGSKENPYTLQI